MSDNYSSETREVFVYDEGQGESESSSPQISHASDGMDDEIVNQTVGDVLRAAFRRSPRVVAMGLIGDPVALERGVTLKDLDAGSREGDGAGAGEGTDNQPSKKTKKRASKSAPQYVDRVAQTVGKSSKGNKFNTPEALIEMQMMEEMQHRISEEWNSIAVSSDFDAEIKARFSISDDYHFNRVSRLSKRDGAGEDYICERASADCIYVHIDNFCAGFRPSFDPFLVEVMRIMKALPSDFHPNTTRTLAAFIVTCRLNKCEPTVAYNGIIIIGGILGDNNGK